MRSLLVAYVVLSSAALLTPAPLPSDHADPIDPLGRKRLEPGITDLFVFPVDAEGRVVNRFERTDGISLHAPNLAERPRVETDIEDLIVILCVRRGLADTGTLRLDPYTYTIHMDLTRVVAFDDEQMRARYGGEVVDPEGIEATATIELRLNDDTSEKVDRRVVTGLKETERIEVVTGVYDDPFIFPMFFKSNVVGMALKIPIECFPDGQDDWIVWATSRKSGRQIDHVGRSSRTQNPRFELLNELHPRRHVAALSREHDHPSLMRDVFLRINVQSLFAFRDWDFVPDVLIYSSRYPVGFPNGRLLDDDVAAILAQFGDTLLYELSFHSGGWPRATENDKEFRTRFPYLAERWQDPVSPARPALRAASVAKLIALITLPIAILVLLVWNLARWHHGRKHRMRYL